MRLFLFATALVFLTASAATQARAAERTRYLELINRAHDSVTSFAIAPPGSDAFREVPMGVALRGGGASATVEIPGGSCRRDLRLEFRNGRGAIYRGFDTCRNGSLRIGKLPRTKETGETAAEHPIAGRFEH